MATNVGANVVTNANGAGCPVTAGVTKTVKKEKKSKYSSGCALSVCCNS